LVRNPMVHICHWALADQPTRQSPVVDTKQDATRQTSYSLLLTACEFVGGRERGVSCLQLALVSFTKGSRCRIITTYKPPRC
jgi:hypothetical protein